MISTMSAASPIRNALQQLTHEGLLSFVPGKGVVVSSFTTEDILEVYDLIELHQIYAVIYVALPRVPRPQSTRWRRIGKHGTGSGRRRYFSMHPLGSEIPRTAG